MREEVVAIGDGTIPAVDIRNAALATDVTFSQRSPENQPAHDKN
jgi:hypothetical protein